MKGTKSIHGLDYAKSRIQNVHKHLGIEYGRTRRGDKYVQINFIPASRSQSRQPEWVKVLYSANRDLKRIREELGVDLKERSFPKLIRLGV